MSSVVWDRIRARPWLDEPPVDIGATVTMLHSEELRMLRWLVREHYTGAGHIMDLGCFLGGSTVALAQGLQASGKPGWIETFDLFQAEDYAGELYGGDQFRAGDRVRHIFDRNVAPYSRLVRVTDGDFLTAPLPDGPIEILFVDLAKWHTLNDRIVEELFPRLIPGRSVVIQQDYVWSCCAWIHVAMEKLKSSFSYLCHVESASVLFGLDRPISREEASAAKWSVMAPGERDAYFQAALAPWGGEKRALIEAAGRAIGLDPGEAPMAPPLAAAAVPAPAAAAAAPLVFDLGVNDGTDTDYYLRKGYRVVGVEAAPDLVAHLHRRFPAEIADGRFVLLDRVLWQQAGLKIPFHVNLDNNEWSSFDPAIAGRDPSHRVVTHEIESTTYEELVTRFGLPRYIKCDIEGGDVIFCEQLSRSPHRPAFVSAELGRKGTVGLMAQAGYDRFQIVNQGIIPGTRAPAGTREGREVDMTFAHTSSGAFGLDLPADRWLDLEDTIAVLNAFTVVWQKAGHLCAAWADVHATRAEHLG